MSLAAKPETHLNNPFSDTAISFNELHYEF
jgi:hypothetical protein